MRSIARRAFSRAIPRSLSRLRCRCLLSLPSRSLRCAAGWPPANRGPTFEEEEEDDDELTGRGAGAGADADDGDEAGYFPAEDADGEGSHPTPTLLQKVLGAGMSFAGDYTIPALKYGWVPLVALLGLTRIYVREERPAFEGPRFLVGMLIAGALGIKQPQGQGEGEMGMEMEGQQMQGNIMQLQ